MRELLEEFTEGLVDRNSRSLGCDPEHPPEKPLLKPLPSHRKGGNHNLCTHFPKDPNCEICMRTKITVLAEGILNLKMVIFHARLNWGFYKLQHRYAIAVQDLQ